MMATHESESLILKSYSLAESDKIVVFLTRDHGLIRGVAKGAKRLKSKFGGGLEPFSVVDLTYFQKEERELVSIDSIDLRKSYFVEAGNPEFLQKFSYLSDLLIEFAPPNEPNETLYRMSKICLETAVSEPQSLGSIALYFEFWILKLSGFLPNWNVCDACQREIGLNDQTNLQINYHLLCSSCRKPAKDSNISSIERNIFLSAQSYSPARFVEYTLDKPEEVRTISQILKRIISHILGKENFGERVLAAL